jgi:hypothetical protein
MPAQQPASAPASESKPVAMPLRVTVVISRYQGDKRTSNLPYTLVVNTGDSTHVQVSTQVPVPTSVTSAGGQPNGTAPISFTYQSVGTSVNCGASTQSDGSYRLDLSVSDSQVSADTQGARATTVPGRPDVPAPSIQQFSTVLRVNLRDGQTLQFTSAVDKTTGEVVKVDVTLAVIK